MFMNNNLKIPEGWKLVKLEEVTEILDNKRIPLDSEFRKNIQGSFPYCGATGIIDYIDNWIFDGEYVLVAEDGGQFYRFEKTAYLMKGKFWANNHVHIIKGKSKCLSNEFLAYFINFEDISSYISGSTREKLNQKLLRNIEIPLPPLPEQQRIAEILETVDNCIEKTQQLIEKYKRIKQGLMEELLTKGIDENGNIRSEKTHRFKDSPLGRIPEEWEVVRLGEVFNIQAAGDISKLNYSEFKDDKYKYPIFSNSLDNKGLYGYSDSYKYPENCITITGRGTLGIAVPRFDKFNAIIRIIILIPKIYLDIIFVTEYINKKVKFVIESAGVPQLTAPKVYNYEIPLPPFPEQQRIAEILFQIDAVIEKEEKYKEKLERLKRGLMEDLLSVKIRVNHLIEENK